MCLKRIFMLIFVSGHLDLAKATGAGPLYLVQPRAPKAFEAKRDAADGEVFKVGKISFKVLHTPWPHPWNPAVIYCVMKRKKILLYLVATLYL
jgi:hypothetical protein